LVGRRAEMTRIAAALVDIDVGVYDQTQKALACPT
jgi:hypothetical protein